MSFNIEKALSKALYVIDPARTCCAENECFDEYDNVASHVIDTIKFENVSIEQAIKTVFLEEFEYELSDSVIAKICDFPIQ